MEKKALSNVVVVLITVFLALVAAGIVWRVVHNSLKDIGGNVSSESSSLLENAGGFGNDEGIILKITNAYIDGNTLDIQIKRESGNEVLVGVRFTLKNKTYSEIQDKDGSLQNSEEKIFYVSPNEISLDNITIASIAPIYKKDSENVVGDITDTISFIRGDEPIPPGGEGGEGGDDGGICVPDPIETVCAGIQCGSTLNNCGDYVDCGDCTGEGEVCDEGVCVVATIINSGKINSTWPEDVNMYFDSEDLPKEGNYKGYYVNFPGSEETRCISILDYVTPLDPNIYNNTLIRLGVSDSKIKEGDLYEIWKYSTCGA